VSEELPVAGFPAPPLHPQMGESCAARQEKSTCICKCFFQLYSPLASSMHFLRDIAFGSDMRFARLLTLSS
jgi:hypothetical protein